MSSRPTREAAHAARPLGMRGRLMRAGAVALAAIALVATGVLVAAFAIVQQGRASALSASASEGIELFEGASSDDGGRTIEYGGARYALNENMVSACFLGFDRETPSEESAGQADAVIVAAFDLDANDVKLISVPRESMVDVEMLGPEGTYGGAVTTALCLAYAYGDGKHTSCANTVRAVSNALYGIPIPFYLALDLSGIVPLNDAVGGVEVTALETIPDSDIEQGQTIRLEGEDARRYVQWRDEPVLESPLQRQARQAQYVEAFASQAASNPAALLDLYQAAAEHVLTNLSMNELGCLALCLAASDASDLDIVTLSGEMRDGASYGEFYLDQAAAYETILSIYYHPVG